jgi:hypothetical protein
MLRITTDDRNRYVVTETRPDGRTRVFGKYRTAAAALDRITQVRESRGELPRGPRRNPWGKGVEAGGGAGSGAGRVKWTGRRWRKKAA